MAEIQLLLVWAQILVNMDRLTQGYKLKVMNDFTQLSVICSETFQCFPLKFVLSPSPTKDRKSEI